MQPLSTSRVCPVGPIVRRGSFLAAAFLALAALPRPGAAATAPQPPPAPASPAAVRVLDASGLELQLGPVLLRLDSGALFLRNTPDEPVSRGVFVGRGSVAFTPKARLEQRQLMEFTGYPSIFESFSSAVIVFGPGALHTKVEGLEAMNPSPPEQSRAKAAWNAWRHSAERRILGVEGLLLRARNRDPLADETAHVLVDGDSLGRFVVTIDPADGEPVTVHAFRPWNLDGHARKKVEKLIQHGIRRRWLDAQATLKGTWTTWVSTALDGSVRSIPLPPPFQVPQMAPDVTLSGSKLRISVRVRIQLRATRNGLRVVRIEVPASLVDLVATAPSGKRLTTCRTPLGAFVLLPAPQDVGAVTLIDLGYHLKAMEHPSRKAYAMSDPTAWLPSVAGATPEVLKLTIHWPKRLELLAPGTVLGEDRVSKGVRSRTVELRPGTSGITFAIGDYDIRRAAVAGQEIVVAADRSVRRYKGSAAEELLAAVKDIVTALRGPFGPLPFGRLTVVTAPQGLSMSFPGFILLSSLTVMDPGALKAAIGIYGTPEGTLAHEIAHQWLGNTMTPATYRDSWWVEGGANYVAERIMFARAAAQGRRPNAGLFPRRRLPETLLLRDGLDRTTLSPPSLGSRLLTGPTHYREYISTLYDGGAQIFFLLDSTAPSRDLLDVLGKVVARHGGRKLSSVALLSEIGKGLGLNALAIAAPFLDGSPTPAVVYGFSHTGPTEGYWRVSGRAHLSALIPTSAVRLSGDVYHPAIVPRDRWVVEGIHPPVGIPFGVFAAVAAKDTLIRKFGTFTGRYSVFALYRKERATYGTMLFDTPRLRFRTQVPFSPADLRLDPDGQLPLITLSQSRNPSLVRLCAGLEQATAGKMDRAAEWFHDITAVCESLDRKDPANAVLEAECVLADMASHIHLGTLALARGDIPAANLDLAAARQSLARATEAVEKVRLPDPPSLLVLEARIALATGKPGTAFTLLSDRTEQPSEPLTPDGYAVLAVAATLSGHPHEATHAWQAATILGLTSPSAGGSSPH
ncbi:MAG: hypothetical protein GXP47_06040 [Acidobacteria bacterium]|nr:hypothetical protein [Acidobacteriota bacterium]